MARVIHPNTMRPQNRAEQLIANFVWWQRDQPSYRYWLILVCGVGFASYGIAFLLRGIQALQQGLTWSGLLATGNHRLPFVSVGREILSGSLILVICTVLLGGLIASRCGWLNRFVED